MLPDTFPHTNVYFLKWNVHRNFYYKFPINQFYKTHLHTLNEPWYLHIEIHRKLLHHVCYNKFYHQVWMGKGEKLNQSEEVNSFLASELGKASEYTLHSCWVASTNHMFTHMCFNLFYIRHFLQHFSPPATCKVIRKLVHSPTTRRIPWPANKFTYNEDSIV